MTTLFIADLHLEEGRPEIAEIFFKFLKQDIRGVKAIYILGDLFEAWIGDDDQSSFNQAVLGALNRVTQRDTAVYFMRGNRDFLIGKHFQRHTGCQILPDEYLIELSGRATLLMHGDTLCTRDQKYLKFRKRTRNFFVQKLFLLKPLSKRRAMVKEARKLSYDHTRSTSPEIMDVSQEEVERIMSKHQVFRLIHGHTHRPAVHQFLLDGQAATRTVLAPWHEQGSALVCHSDGRQEFIELN